MTTRRKVLIGLAILAGICKGLLHNENAQGWDKINTEAVTLQKEHKYAQAAIASQHVLEVAEKQFGPNDRKTATSLNNLAAVYFAQGKYTEAEPLFKRSLAIKEKAVGANSADLIPLLQNMANLYRKMGQENVAVGYEKRAASIETKK